VSVLLDEALREVGGSPEVLANPLFTNALPAKDRTPAMPSLAKSAAESPKSAAELPAKSAAESPAKRAAEPPTASAKTPPAPSRAASPTEVASSARPDRSRLADTLPAAPRSDRVEPIRAAARPSGARASRSRRKIAVGTAAGIGVAAALFAVIVARYGRSGSARPTPLEVPAIASAPVASPSTQVPQTLPVTAAQEAPGVPSTATSTTERGAAEPGAVEPAAPSTAPAAASGKQAAASASAIPSARSNLHPSAALAAPAMDDGSAPPVRPGHRKPSATTKTDALSKPTWLLRPSKVDNPY
jgi:Meckel syndrome type 1 protein